MKWTRLLLPPALLAIGSISCMERPFPLAALNADCLAVVASHVPAATIDIAIKKIKALSLANSHLLTSLNTKRAASYITAALARRFKTYQLTAAFQLATPGSYAWQTAQILETEDYQTFQAVQKILAIFEELREKAETLGVGFVSSNDFNAHFLQTKRGLFVSVDKLPHALHTPWGGVSLTGSQWTGPLQLYITQLFFQRVQAKFIKFEVTKGSLHLVDLGVDIRVHRRETQLLRTLQQDLVGDQAGQQIQLLREHQVPVYTLRLLRVLRLVRLFELRVGDRMTVHNRGNVGGRRVFARGLQ